jgi:hypothetical protein
MKVKKIKDKDRVSADGTIPLITGGVDVVYSKTEINSNWLLNKLLGTKGQQITKISDNDLMKFLTILDQSRLKMPDGSDSLRWLRQRLDKRYQESQVLSGESWDKISRRYQFILHQIDILLAIRSPDSC